MFLVDQAPGADPGMTPREARALAEALIAAARKAERSRRTLREVAS